MAVTGIRCNPWNRSSPCTAAGGRFGWIVHPKGILIPRSCRPRTLALNSSRVLFLTPYERLRPTKKEFLYNLDVLGMTAEGGRSCREGYFEPADSP